MKDYRITIYRDGGLYGYRIYYGNRKVGAVIGQYDTAKEAEGAANREIEYLKSLK